MGELCQAKEHDPVECLPPRTSMRPADRVGRGHDVASRPPPSHTTVRTVPYTAVHEKYLSLRCS